jgi:hypothetical protein
MKKWEKRFARPLGEFAPNTYPAASIEEVGKQLLNLYYPTK